MKQGFDYPGVSVGALVFDSKGQILLMKRSQNAKNERGKWEAPGGAVEFWEKREDAIRREVIEELGVEIEILDVLPAVDEILKKDKQHWVSTAFVVKIKKGEPKILEPDKFDEIGWFDLDNLPQPMSYISTENIKDYKRLGR